MIFIDINKAKLPAKWKRKAKKLTQQLIALPEGDRSLFIENQRKSTWGDPACLKALRSVVGNKCWYSEVPLEGADPNVDHFHPKGRVKVIDEKFEPTGETLSGYWWWAFEWRNFRLAAMHANQRRVDEETNGGKADYFPVLGARAVELTDYSLCIEQIIPLDPCSISDVALLWFDPNGVPSCSSWRAKPSDAEIFRVKASIWLYHLDKGEIKDKRQFHMEQIYLDLKNANTHYVLWKTIPNNQISKNSFDTSVATLKLKIADSADFVSAKKCALRAATAEFEWIFDFGLL